MLSRLNDGIDWFAVVLQRHEYRSRREVAVPKIMADRLKGKPTRANFRTGDLTVCTLVPMRSIPHRVVCLLGLDDGKVQFRWKDYRDNSRHKTMTLVAEEFIRRFLLHVLPEGFQRIRYYGFLANRYRAEKLALCRQLLQIPPPAPNLEVKKDYRNRYEEITGVSLKTCPQCHHGTMIVIERFECAPCRTPRMDTS